MRLRPEPYFDIFLHLIPIALQACRIARNLRHLWPRLLADSLGNSGTYPGIQSYVQPNWSLENMLPSILTAGSTIVPQPIYE